MKILFSMLFLFLFLPSAFATNFSGGAANGGGQATSIASGNYLNDVRVSSAIYANTAGNGSEWALILSTTTGVNVSSFSVSVATYPRYKILLNGNVQGDQGYFLAIPNGDTAGAFGSQTSYVYTGSHYSSQNPCTPAGIILGNTATGMPLCSETVIEKNTYAAIPCYIATSLCTAVYGTSYVWLFNSGSVYFSNIPITSFLFKCNDESASCRYGANTTIKIYGAN